jgi:NTE family protein
MKARELQSYQNSTEHPFIHLLDGGLTDNLGLRGPFEDITVKGGIRNKVGDDLDPSRVSKLAMIVVNAAFRGDRGWDHHRKPPNIVQVTLALGTVPMNRYSFETLEILRANARQWETEWSDGNHASSTNAATAERTSRRVQIYVIEISFDDLQDETEKAYFEKLPTAFNLPAGAVPRLRAVAGKLLNQSETYRALLHDLANDSLQAKGVLK